MKLPHESFTLPEWHNQPLYLTQQQISDPQSLLTEFFRLHPLPVLRELLYDWLDETLEDRHEIPCFIVMLYYDLLPVLEAAWLVHHP
ncbi:hypothetical protein ACTHGU_17090 [Chitinophagaceae bacterium MMS25-I14]